jgi:exodeoxyribonuclease VII large subunit
MKSYTVAEINELIKKKMSNMIPTTISVKGEISNKKLSNGHVYMNIKDKNSMISAIIWKSVNSALNFDLNNGDEVIASGRINVYTKNGSYALHVNDIEKKDEKGEIFKQYQKLKEKCTQKGYFKQDNKKDIPRVIKSVGIITAAHGAALQDILYVLDKNNVNVDIYVKNCQVQGVNCHDNIAKSIRVMKKLPLDVIIMGRGGGSMEDLMGWSHEKVVKAIYNCNVPVISAVGHEIDFMLSDFVADIRAPTPSIAGEIISDSYNKLLNDLNTNLDDNKRILTDKITEYRNKLDILSNKLKFLDPKVMEQRSLQYSGTHVIIKCDGKIISSKHDFLKLKDGVFKLVFVDGEVNVVAKVT